MLGSPAVRVSAAATYRNASWTALAQLGGRF